MGPGLNRYTLVQRLAVSLAVLLAACATSPDSTPHTDQDTLAFDPGFFAARPDIVDAAVLFDLSENQEQAFLEFFHDPAKQTTDPHERVYEYLSFVTSEFDFHSDTRTAAQALDTATGNCLSLAIVTTALANLANVETGYQLVDSTPVFERRGSIVSKAIHVRSILYDPAWQPENENVTASKRPGIQFDYFPEDTVRVRVIGNLSPAAYIAMYYSNVAGEAIAAGDIDSAFWYLLESLEQEPNNAIALNMMAVVYRRAGDEKMAEQIYRHGIDSLPQNVSILRNYHFLLRSQGRDAEAESISRSLAKLDDTNPFNWVNAGRSALADGDNREAIGYFKQALEIAPYLHEAHALTAIAYLRMGNKKRGERELERALENAQRQTTRSLYQAKLTAFGH
jgi:Tfp pilus assembly protein PilF